MNLRLSIFFQSLIIVALFFTQSFAASVVSIYPQYRLTPKYPTVQDSVSFRLVKGMYGNSCPPRSIVSFKITLDTCFLTPCPTSYSIVLSYTQSMVQPLQNEIACLAVMTEYGPEFNFGALAEGNYRIIDSTDKNRTLMTFAVTVGPYGHSVQCTPTTPTTKDSLFFSLYSINYECCTKIYDTSVQVSDTSINLSYAYNPFSSCMCYLAGERIAFKTGPLKAGKYAIYDVARIYCPPDSVCSQLEIMPLRVGQITVTAGTGIGPVMNTQRPVQRFTWTWRSGSIALHYRHALVSDVFSAIYNPQGSMVKKMHLQRTGAELYEAVWETAGADNSSIVPGTYFVRIVADGKTSLLGKISVLK